MGKTRTTYVKRRLIQELTIYAQFNDDKDSQLFAVKCFSGEDVQHSIERTMDARYDMHDVVNSRCSTHA